MAGIRPTVSIVVPYIGFTSFIVISYKDPIMR